MFSNESTDTADLREKEADRVLPVAQLPCWPNCRTPVPISEDLNNQHRKAIGQPSSSAFPILEQQYLKVSCSQEVVKGHHHSDTSRRSEEPE